ncbi:serine acetyltransferase [Methylotenera sp.]|uniref:serine acetyltransferase n=1 Tax=Methylotenera sp. TaxID=2051956 RepID=UPI002730F63F|nr:serine acetyltransferase [Methylotenera sp.]MDP2071653.1 serine acetyltransferase [Methylotenera sp.]MDP3006743.1 serine acetyltransferase [Methylotenera sp.]MDP3817748.1 serine acetyltransferase [Methylotenera sp.]
MNIENPAAAKLLIWATKRRKTYPRLHRLICVVLGSDVFCSIPRGIVFPHPYGIVIHSETVIGDNTIVMQQVTMGGKSLIDPVGAPILGDNCYVGAGAKILGPVRIGNNVTIGANAVVTKDIADGNVVVGVNQILEKS